MPTYEYKCNACEHRFERFQSITAAPIRRCPECGKNKVQRLIGTGAGLIFKGSGFYITDYRSDGYKSAAKSESGGGSSGGTGGGGGTGTGGSNGSPGAGGDGAAPKPAAAAEAKPAAVAKTETKAAARK